MANIHFHFGPMDVSPTRVTAATRIVAPVGKQPSAVLAPLLTLQAFYSVSEVVLVTTDAVRDKAGLIARLLPCTLHATIVDDEKAALNACLGDKPDACLLVNGGQWPTVERCRAALFGRAPANSLFAWSRDHELLIFDSELTRLAQHPITSPPLVDLLELNGLRYCGDRLSGTTGGDRLEGVTRLHSHFGFLYAELDATVLSGDPRRSSAEKYFDAVLRRGRLQRLGLDLRRILLTGLPADLVQSAEEDGVRYTKDPEVGGHTAERWRKEISRLPAPAAAPRPRAFRAAAAAPPEWTGPPVVAVAGTNPGNLLLRLWATCPRKTLLVFEQASPLAAQAAVTLAQELAPWCEVDLLNTLHTHAGSVANIGKQASACLGEGAHILTGPGDKYSQLLLSALRLPAAPDVDFRHAPPLDLWLRAHAPFALSHLKPPLTDELSSEAAAAVLNDLSATDDTAHFNALTARRSCPRVAEDELVTTCQSFSLDADSWLLSSDITVWGANGPHQGSGLWWEHVCATALNGVVDELLWSVPYIDAVHPERRRTELDIVARVGGVYFYVECKVGNSVLRDYATARGRAERLLGPYAATILAIPHPTPPTRPGMCPAGVRKVEDRGYLVGSKLLADPDALKKLIEKLAA